jgi:hypothetical protein
MVPEFTRAVMPEVFKKKGEKMKKKSALHWDFEAVIRGFVEDIIGEKDDSSTDKLCHKVFFKAFEEAACDIESIINDIRYKIENNFNSYRDLIADELTEEFCKYIWRKWQDGHDFSDNEPCICYFKDKNKYIIGKTIATKDDQGMFGTGIILENGEMCRPDYVCPLYPFEESQE